MLVYILKTFFTHLVLKFTCYCSFYNKSILINKHLKILGKSHSLRISLLSQAWGCNPRVPALNTLRQEECHNLSPDWVTS